MVDSARAVGASDIHVVYGHGGERVREALHDDALRWALQAEQQGTGHAVMQAMPGVADDALVLVLYGDVPLVRPQTLERLVAAASDRTLAVLSVRMKDPTGYGRVVRDRAGRVVRIVEHKDANAKERAIDEVNTGLMAAPAARLKTWLGRLTNDNAQGEYYLTDVVVQAVKDGIAVDGVLAESEEEVLGVNDKQQLAEVEAVNRRRRAEELMAQGVTLVDPARFDARGPVEVGQDVYIDVNVVFEGTVKLGDRVRIGPNVVLRNCTIGADTQIFPSCVLYDAEIGARCNVGPFARFRPGAVLEDEVHIGNFVEVKKSQGEARREGQPPELHRRCDRGGEGQCRRRNDLLQLRRCEQVADRDRRWRLHRLGHDAGRPGQGRRERDHRRRLDDHEGRAAGQAHHRAQHAAHHRGLETTAEEAVTPRYNRVQVIMESKTVLATRLQASAPSGGRIL